MRRRLFRFRECARPVPQHADQPGLEAEESPEWTGECPACTVADDPRRVNWCRGQRFFAEQLTSAHSNCLERVPPVVRYGAMSQKRCGEPKEPDVIEQLQALKYCP